MKAKKLSVALILVVAGSIGMASCVEKNYYEANPNNNYNQNNNQNYTYTFDEEFNGYDNYFPSFADPTDSVYASITNGTYEYVDYSATESNTTVINTGNNVSGNFTVQTRIESNNMMGLIFGASSTDNGYAFYIDSLGNYSLYKEGDSTASTAIIAATADSQIVKKGWNILELNQSNGYWIGYINNTQVFDIAAEPVSGSNFGFKILPGTVGYADYLIVKNSQ